MRDRLIELLKQKSCVYVPCDNECGGCKNVEMYDDSIESIADHLLSEGVIVPPCKVGQKVYVVNGISDGIVEGFIEHLDYNFYTTPQEWITVKATYPLFGELEHKSRIDLLLGKTIFLTREEAENALERSENGKS